MDTGRYNDYVRSRKFKCSLRGGCGYGVVPIGSQFKIFRENRRKGHIMSECARNMEVAPLTMEQFEVLNKKNCMLEDENRKLKSDIRELQRVIVNMCYERYSHYRPD